MNFMIRNQRGFTLVEMVVVMGVFIIILIISANAFKTIITQSSKLIRSEESNIEGVVGLEMLRHDLQQAGYGLFSEVALYPDEAANIPASNFNDAPNHVPRPIVAGNNMGAMVTIDSRTIMLGSDYLAIKGTTVGRDAAAQKWTFLNFSANVVTPKKWVSDSENLAPPEKAILIQKQFGTPMRSSLVPDPSNSFYYAYSDVGFGNLSSAAAGIYTVYGRSSEFVTFSF
jgi:prepilin-type N-terminal cleavage/methylation domain-containing protein